MSGVPSVTTSEARGSAADNAELDQLCVVMGCSSAGSLLAPTNYFLAAASAQASIGYGDAPDTVFQAIEQRLPSGGGVKRPVSFQKLAGSTAGYYGVIDNTGVTGTGVPAVDSSTEPFGTYDAGVRIIAGGTLGTAGITYQRRQDYSKTWSNTIALGVGHEISFPNSGTGFILGPPAAQVTAFIAAAVEARTKTLAHLANVTAHDAADTSAAQVALAASSVPATAAAAWAVLNLCRTALASHENNIVAHNGPDPVNVVTHAAATDVQSGIDLYIDYKAAFNAHLSIALAAAPAGLKAATATLATTLQTFTSADLLDAGEALLATYPRRLTFTTAGGTASDAPSTATTVGTDYADAAQTETALALAQTATLVTTTDSFKTITSIAYAADGGTGATIAIGYGQGVHNSADVTNPLTSDTPTHGTLVAGDEWVARTFAPAPSAADLDAGFVTLAGNAIQHALIALDFPLTAALAAHVTTGLNLLEAKGKFVTCLAKYRMPDLEEGETEDEWATALQDEFSPSAFSDSRIILRSQYGLVTDAVTTRVYYRSDFQQFVADVVATPRSEWPCIPADPRTGASGIPNVSLTDGAGTLVGHDDGPRGNVGGLSNDTLGNRFSCATRIVGSNPQEAPYNAVPWTLYTSDERIKTLMVRRIAQAMKRVARARAVSSLGGKVFYTPANPNILGSTPTLKPQTRIALHSIIFRALSQEFRDDIQNPDDADQDTGLVQIASALTLTGGNFAHVTSTLQPLVFGHLLTLVIVLSVKV